MASPVSAFPSANTTSGTFTNVTYAYADDTSYASTAPAKNASNYVTLSGFGFDSSIPAGAVISNVNIEVGWYVSVNSSVATLKMQPYVSGVAKGTALTNSAEPIAITVQSSNFSLTRDQLLDAVFAVRVTMTRGNSSTAFTGYLDYVKVTVTYTLPAPTISVTGYNKTKLSHQSGMTSCTVTFQSDLALQAWEARAGGSGQGQGLLVGSGTTLAANTSQQFTVDDTELTNGDLDYRITVYGQNVEGNWSGY